MEQPVILDSESISSPLLQMLDEPKVRMILERAKQRIKDRQAVLLTPKKHSLFLRVAVYINLNPASIEQTTD
jgi:uncharacterized protein (DUF1778 family)